MKLTPEQIDELRAEYKKVEINLTTKPIPDVKVEVEKVKKEMTERQDMEKELMLKEIEKLRKERDQSVTIAKEIVEDVKRLKEEVLKTRGNGEGKCVDGENCQKVIGEEELEEWLAKGWEAKIVLPSGKIVIEKI